MVDKRYFGLIWFVFQNVQSENLLHKMFRINNNLMTRNLSSFPLGNAKSEWKCGALSMIKNYRIFIFNNTLRPNCKGCAEFFDQGDDALTNLHYTAWETGNWVQYCFR